MRGTFGSGVPLSRDLETKATAADPRIEDALKLVGRDVPHSFRPTHLAAIAGLSVSRFYDLFREATGIAPAKYIRRQRFEKAKELLLAGNFSAKEVAHQAGIHDDSHFVRDFQKLYGLSPRAFSRARRRSP
jgi:AraC-like DNA-binding protein